MDHANCGFGTHTTTKANYLWYGTQQSQTASQCRSRCGGCDAIAGTSAWTQDCGNHDACEWYHTNGCQDEYDSATDDFLFAPNCENCG